MNELEEWKDITGYNNFEVSNKGEIRNKINNTIKKQYLRNGYYSTSLYENKVSKTLNIHRIVAIEFLGNFPNKHVNHKDGNKLNNNLENLEWVTPKENTQHAIINNLSKTHPRKIGQYKDGTLINEFNSMKEAEEKTGISNKHIGSVCRGNRKTTGGYEWKYLDEDFIEIKKENVNGKIIKDFPNYMITEDCKIYSIKRKDYLKPKRLQSGYYTVKLCNNDIKKDVYIHAVHKEYYS
jgi:hypothetical protein